MSSSIVRLCIFSVLLLFLMILFVERLELRKDRHDLDGRTFPKSTNSIQSNSHKNATVSTDTTTNNTSITTDDGQQISQESTIVTLNNLTPETKTTLQSPPHEQQQQHQDQSYFTYNTSTIIQIAKQLSVVTGKLLIYDPSEDRFHIYTITPNETALARMVCPRCPNTLRVLLNVIRKLRPERFQSNATSKDANMSLTTTRPYQLLWTDRDFPFTYCAPETCFSHPSWLHFGSYYRNRTLLPHVQVKPNFNYLACMYEVFISNEDPNKDNNDEDNDDDLCTYWKGIVWANYDHDNETINNTNNKNSNQSSIFASLISKLVWRGKDYHLLPHVPLEYFVGNYSIPYYDFKPRMYAALLNHPWMDVTFGSNTGGTRYNSLSHEELANYKYHVDFGGTSGTTWTGTLEKLAMPGVLLHHETPSQDWYFDQMVPWIHYIPIRTDVSDLEEQYRWAEKHPLETEQMARAGTAFAHYMFSKRTIRQELESYFGESSTMGPILDGYQATDNETLESILATYVSQKIYLTEVATCDWNTCDVRIQPTFQYQFSLTNRSDCNVIRCPY